MSAPASPATPRRTRGSGVWLFAGTLAGNLFAYGFFVVLARRLDADELGAVGSLVNLATVTTVAGVGLQLVAARAVAGRGAHGRGDALPSTDDASASHETLAREALATGARIGLALAGLLALSSPLTAALLHLDGVSSVLALAVTIAPMVITYAAQGLLQGHERFGALAAAYLLVGVVRIGTAVVGVAAGLGVAGVLWVYAVAWWLTAVGVVATLPAAWRRFGGRGHALAEKAWRAALPVSGLLVLSNLDVLLARHHLDGAASGAYTMGALFEKAAFWGTAFLATLYYPRMARPAERRQAIRTALGLTLGAGVVGIAIGSLAGPLLVRLVGGEAFVASVAPLVALFVTLGLALAVLQVLVYAELSAYGRRATVGVWVAVVLALGLTAVWHDSVGAVLRGMLAASGVGILIAVGQQITLPRSRV